MKILYLIGLFIIFSTINKAIEKGEDGFSSWPECPEIDHNGNCHEHNDAWKDTLFIDVKVEDLIFGGTIPGVVRWVYDKKMKTIGSALPSQIGSEQFPNGSFHGTNGFALFNGKNSTAFNEYYEIRTGADDHMDDYYMIEKWGKENGTLWDDLTPANWWKANGSYLGSNDCNTLKGKVE